jgi:formate dehydrogenase major subunit
LQPISGDDAFTRIAKLMKADRDAHFEAKDKDGRTVNRCNSAGFLAASASSNETPQDGQNPGDAAVRQSSAGMTRPDGGKSCPDVWPRRHDQSLDRHQERRSDPHHGRQCR